MVESYFQRLSDVMAVESRALGDVYRHRGKLGENREALLQRFLAGYLPRRFGVGSGFALFGDAVSTQQDVVVYDRLNSPVLYGASAAPLFPPSALAAVVEVKSSLDRGSVAEVVEKGRNVKLGLREAFANHPAPPRREALAIVFAFASSLGMGPLLEQVREAEESLDVAVADRLDLVCVLGRGVVLGGSLLATALGNPVAASPQGQQRAAVELENSLFIFYSCLLDYIVAREPTRPQLMSYLPSGFPLGRVVAVG